MNFKKFIYKNLEIRLILYIVIFYTAHTLIAFLNLLRKRALAEENSEALIFSISQLVQVILVDWILVILFMTIVSLVVKKFRKKNVSWWKVLGINVFFSICMIILTQVILDLQVLSFAKKSFGNYSLTDSIVNALNLIELYFLIYASLLFIIYIYFYIQELKEKEMERRQLQEELIEAKVSILKSQMNPHFLFNTLNSISSLIDESKTKAQNTIVDLSNFLRKVLNIGESNTITLKHELDLLEDYVAIMKVRHGHHLKIKQKVDFKCYNYHVPALSLQPIVENALEHGYSKEHKILNIDICISELEGKIHIKIFNDGKLLASDDTVFENGIGLSNLSQRIEKLYGEKSFFAIYNVKEKEGVMVEFIVPIEK